MRGWHALQAVEHYAFMALVFGNIFLFPLASESGQAYVDVSMYAAVILTASAACMYLAVVIGPTKTHAKPARRAFRTALFGSSLHVLTLYYAVSAAGSAVVIPELTILILVCIWTILSFHYIFRVDPAAVVVAKRFSYTCWYALLFCCLLVATDCAFHASPALVSQPALRFGLLATLLVIGGLALFPLRHLLVADEDIENRVRRLKSQLTRFRYFGTLVGSLACLAYVLLVAELESADWLYKTVRGWMLAPFMAWLLFAGLGTLPRVSENTGAVEGSQPSTGNFWGLTAYAGVLAVLYLLPDSIARGMREYVEGNGGPETLRLMASAGGVVLIVGRFLFKGLRR